ncbi:sugar ABC transporter substrate-binding protein [Kineococcus glutinatus]|uniref:Sugar ABC transporter substrate-binding protein n=1 Tax=Kineococcus glutinatus TaxID=1070872 RepID=A0ABP9HHS0_9ACTN
MPTTSRAARALLALAVTASLAACSQPATGTGAAAATAGAGNADAQPPTPPPGVAAFEPAQPGSGAGLTIGFTQLALSAPFPQAVQRSVEEQAEIAGVELVTCDSKLDASRALDCARQFATQQVDGLITFQADANAAASICDAGPQVPVMAVDIEQQPCQTAFVGAANTYAGEVLGFHLGEYFRDEEGCEYDAFVSLESTAVGEVNEQRMGGIRSGFESVCGPIHDLRTIDTGAGGQADAAQRQMTDTLTALPGAEKVITVGINEDVIVAALAAARSQNRTDSLYLGVQNFDPANCTIYDAPHYVGSTAYFPERYGELLVPNLIRAVKGEQVPAQLLVPHEWVTRDNVEQHYPDFAC